MRCNPFYPPVTQNIQCCVGPGCDVMQGNLDAGKRNFSALWEGMRALPPHERHDLGIEASIVPRAGAVVKEQ